MEESMDRKSQSVVYRTAVFQLSSARFPLRVARIYERGLSKNGSQDHRDGVCSRNGDKGDAPVVTHCRSPDNAAPRRPVAAATSQTLERRLASLTLHVVVLSALVVHLARPGFRPDWLDDGGSARRHADQNRTHPIRYEYLACSRDDDNCRIPGPVLRCFHQTILRSPRVTSRKQ